MGSLDRLKRLESMFRQCSECGSSPLPSGALGYEEDVVVEWDDGWEEAENGELVPAQEDDTEPEYCRNCLEPIVLVVTWGDFTEEEEELPGW